ASPVWSSSDTTVVSMLYGGLALGVRPGTAWIRADLNGARDSVEIRALTAFGAIGPEGGVIGSRGDSVQLVFPPGALPAGVHITIDAAVGYPAHPGLVPGLVLEFAPDGISFAVPVTVRLRYDEALLPPGTP